MKIKFGVLLLLIAIFSSCSDDVLPKPKAFLRLDYPEASYQKVESDCPYSFQISQFSIAKLENNCWMKIHYPSMKATLHITYRNIENKDLISVLKEVEKLTYEHTVKADKIVIEPYENNVKRVYGKLINVEGDVASNLQFSMTDSIKNVLYGALYFKVKPNYDSILPAIDYIEKDVKNLMESVAWKNN